MVLAVPIMLMIGLCLTLAPSPASAGHELPYYPSFYPQEIRLESMEPDAAAALLRQGTIQAYIGPELFPSRPPPAGIDAAVSLEGYLVVTFKSDSTSLPDRVHRCAAAAQLRQALARTRTAYRPYPSPITPYHVDYLAHYDTIEAARRVSDDVSQQALPSSVKLSVRAPDLSAEPWLPSPWQTAETAWDVMIEAVDIEALAGEEVPQMNGWQGPPWHKAGWYHAYRLLAPYQTDGTAKAAAESLFQRLTHGRYQGQEERLNLERRLVALLTHGCDRVVLGYRLRHEYYCTDFSAGVENVAYDAQAGLNAGLFIRTVKLKDFPWNGWLRIGMQAKPQAAWNPIAGFTDAMGRLLWAAVGDPALLPAPHNGGWLSNRFSPNISITEAGTEGLPIPPEALYPEPDQGTWRGIPTGRRAAIKLTYRVLSSAFHDGTSLSVADLLYAYSLALRWGTSHADERRPHDAAIAAATALMRAKLAGVRVLGVEHEPRGFGDVKLTQDVPVIDVYLNEITADFPGIAAIAPPWSTVPWQLMVLMEEAVQRGLAAFSMTEAQRRGLPWLDLVRDQRLQEQLLTLVTDFEGRGYRPAALQPWVTEAAARERWAALKAFYLAHGHFLVTNGPYRLAKWDESAVVLQVFRALSYPLGVGSYDKYAYPPRALLSALNVRPNRLELSADMEKLEKAQRSYERVRQRLDNEAMVGVYRVKPAATYIALSPAGEVVKAGLIPYAGDGIFALDLQSRLSPGRYLVLTTIYLNENYIEPDVRMVACEVMP